MSYAPDTAEANEMKWRRKQSSWQYIWKKTWREELYLAELSQRREMSSLLSVSWNVYNPLRPGNLLPLERRLSTSTMIPGSTIRQTLGDACWGGCFSDTEAGEEVPLLLIREACVSFMTSGSDDCSSLWWKLRNAERKMLRDGHLLKLRNSEQTTRRNEAHWLTTIR